MNAADYVNQVLFRGGIVHKFRADKWLVLTLATSLNQSNKDYPKVYWYDELIDKIDQSYDVGDRVEITGRIRTSKAHPEQSIVGQTIKQLPRWIDAKFNADEYLPDQNEVLLKGEFVRVYTPDESLSVVTLKTIINDYTYFPRVTCFGKQAVRASEIPEGSVIYFVAHVQTRKKETEEGVQHYQSVVCRNMKVS